MRRNATLGELLSWFCAIVKGSAVNSQLTVNWLPLPQNRLAGVRASEFRVRVAHQELRSRRSLLTGRSAWEIFLYTKDKLLLLSGQEPFVSRRVLQGKEDAKTVPEQPLGCFVVEDLAGLVLEGYLQVRVQMGEWPQIYIWVGKGEVLAQCGD